LSKSDEMGDILQREGTRQPAKSTGLQLMAGKSLSQNWRVASAYDRSVQTKFMHRAGGVARVEDVHATT
jgi:hypothetical protein